MNRKMKRILALMLSFCMVLSGITVSRKSTNAAELSNVVFGKENYTFLTSNANNKSEGFVYIGNGLTSIQVCNENYSNANNLLGATASTDEVAIYVDLRADYDISYAQVYQGSGNASYPDSYCKKYSIYYSTQTVSTANQGKIDWQLAGTCEHGTIYSGAQRKNATDVSTTGDRIDFDTVHKARSVKIVFDKESCMGSGSTQGTVSIASFQVYGSASVSGGQSGEDDGVVDVLFIGNSFMYYNTSWNVFQGLAEYNGHNVKVTAATNGGQDLTYQSTAGNVLDAIKVGGYDVVVLQDKVGSNFQESTLMNGSKAIIPIIRQYSPNARLVYYEPWPIRSQIESKMSYFTSSYINAAKTYGAALAPAGEGFYDLFHNDHLEYYCSDDRHPQPLGTFNSASTIYYAMFPEDGYRVYTESDHDYLDQLINRNVAYTSEGQQTSYSLDTLNKITSYAYKYAHAVIPAVSGTGTYTSVADGGTVAAPTPGEIPQTTTPSVTPTQDQDQDTQDILFIGNSMTYYNNLCKVVQGIAERKGKKINCAAATNGGQNLVYQSTADNVLSAIRKGGYETVVLQDIVGGFDDVKLQNGAEAVIAQIRQYNPDAQILFYEPWPTKDTISGSESLLPYFTHSYIKTAKSVDAELAPAGEAFYQLYTEHNLDFYCDDNKHPQPLGTFTSASTIYHALYPQEEYQAFTKDDQQYLDQLINTNVAFTEEGKQDTYALDTLNLIFSLGYQYAHAVIPAVSGTEKYTSVAGEYVDLDEEVNPQGLAPVKGETVEKERFSADGGNMAVSRKAYASSGNAALGVNGNTADRWESDRSDPQWFYVDLGDAKDFDTVGFIWEGAYASKYYIQISDNADTWQTIAYVTATTNETVQIPLGQTYHARYVRMYGTKRGTGYGYSFFEMGIWNKHGVQETTTAKTDNPQETPTGDSTVEIIRFHEPSITSIAGDVISRSVSFSWDKSAKATTYTTFVGTEEDGVVARAYHNDYPFERVAQASVDHVKVPAGETALFTVVGYDTEGKVVARGTLNVEAPALSAQEKEDAALVAKIGTEENLAKGKTAFVSSNDGTPITDGNLASKWQANPAENPDDNPLAEYFGVDLGSAQNIGVIIIAWENSYATAYNIYLAGEDGVYGDTPAASGTASGNNPIVITKIAPTAARYVKVVPTELSANAKNYGTSIFELAVLGAQNVGTETTTPEETESPKETTTPEETESPKETVTKPLETESSKETTTKNPDTELPNPPEKPDGVTVSGTVVTWETGGDIAGYNVYVNGNKVATVVTGSIDLQEFLTEAGSYTVEIRAVDFDGVESESVTVTVNNEANTTEKVTPAPTEGQSKETTENTQAPTEGQSKETTENTQAPTQGQSKETTGSAQETTQAPTTTGGTDGNKVVSVGKTKVKKTVKKKSAKKIKITLKKKTKYADGYQVRFFTKKKNARKNKKAVAKVLYKKNKKTFTVTSKKIKNKNTLFMRVRAYTTAGGKKSYGKWSAVIKVKVR